ncbi:MAG: hypothetical protein RBU37_23580 [Myxococcota bacterium]|jgi:V/A-type H+-transporting ATPase subunit K|nr:hypothetical protein [Myxococcota bacterium]
MEWMQILAYFGLGVLGLGLSGSAIGLAVAGSAVAGMRAERRNNGLAVSVLPGTQGLYSFAVGFLCIQALKPVFSGEITGADAERTFLIVFASGVITGISCLFSGWFQGKVCAAGIKSINQDRMGMGQAILLAVFPEFYAILGFAFSALLLFAST